MSIGDWSGDGHEKKQDFIVKSNVPVEIVREAHWNSFDATGINIEEICSDYEEVTIEPDVVNKLKELGFHFSDIDIDGDEVYPTAYEMIRIWLFLLEKTDPYLELEVVADEIPNFHFFGCNKQGQHIGQVGYGLFE
jgi:hypothetical protein